ncbi:MAG: DUF2207 domain-containing protein [Micropruina sp.]|uniref:DUF2207 domain-containing protein n=1 Tax=Micropruina sp. TaxID=2737536 RepID=UPI0039E3C539
MSRSPITPFARLFAGLLVLVTVLLGPAVPRAFAAELVSSYAVEGSIAADGTLTVQATISFDGDAPASLVQRFATSRPILGDREYVYRLSDIKATVAGQPINATVVDDNGYTVVTMPTQGVTAPVVLSYVVHGAATAEQSGETTVAWRLLQGLSLPVREFTATLTTPVVIQSLQCEAGPPASPGVCGFWGGGTHDHPNPTFNDGPRGAGEVVEAIVRFPVGTVTANEQIRQLWTLGRAFSAEPLPLSLALGLLVLGGLGFWALHRRIGRDAVGTGDPTLVAEFHPVGDGESEFRVRDGVRPGQVGTLVDERVDPVDVTATLLDLAVRGHLRVEELPRSSTYAEGEWTFTRRSGGDELRPYERTLLDAVAPEGGRPLAVSELPAAIGTVIGTVQDQLYDDVVALGWFARRPDQTRNTWFRAGFGLLVAAVLATIVLVAFTSFGLVGLALIAVALLVAFLGQEMPARTARGVSLLNGLGLLRAQLLGHPTDQMPKGRELHELSEVLPYAVVLGGYERWLKALVDADDDPDADSQDLDWYHAPEDWHLSDLPASLNRLVTTIQGKLFAR